jgi:xanthine dehydrogenase YagR molybdenum-binding subunit
MAKGAGTREARRRPQRAHWDKVTGRARYAAEYCPGPTLAYAVPVQSTIARGEVASVDCETPLSLPGMLAVLWHGNAPELGTSDDPELDLFQSPRIAHRGQFVAAVVAETLEAAYEAARRIQVEYVPEPHDVVLRLGHPRAYRPPDDVPGGTVHGAVDRALREAAVAVDVTYTSPAYHHNPMEPQATVAAWEEQGLTLYDSCPRPSAVRKTLARLFTLPPDLVRVVARYVGAGAECSVRPQTVLAAMAAKVVGRPVKVALTRRQMFSVPDYRTPLIQRVRLAADAGGRLTAIAHDTVEQTSALKELGEPVTRMSRMMYAAPNRRVTHEVVPLDVPAPSWPGALGGFPAAFALESAMDELAIACGLDPIELRVRNRPEVCPYGHVPRSFSLVACLREGAERFGWAGRDPTPGARRDGRWLIGTGVAAATCPVWTRLSEATALLEADGRFRVRITASGMRADERAALLKIAADTLRVAPERVRLELRGGPPAHADEPGGAVIWTPAVVRACEALVEQLEEDDALAGGGHGVVPGAVPGPARGVGPPREATASLPDTAWGQGWTARHAFGAQFAEVRVDADTGEVRVPRLLGVFAAGRVPDQEETRSRFAGAMTMGLSMALLEQGVLDERFGDFVNHDLSRYLIATSADVGDVEIRWIEDDGPEAATRATTSSQGMERAAEIGIVGAAAAIANAVHHATGIRVRDLPIRLDRLIGPGAGENGRR